VQPSSAVAAPAAKLVGWVVERKFCLRVRVRWEKADFSAACRLPSPACEWAEAKDGARRVRAARAASMLVCMMEGAVETGCVFSSREVKGRAKQGVQP
jgi:hypothetical protein